MYIFYVEHKRFINEEDTNALILKFLSIPNNFSGYRVEKKDTQKGRWEPVKDNIKGSEFTVPKLTEGRDYHFRVAALNDNGESDFLETDSPVTAKNPFGNSSNYFSFIKLLCFAMQGFNKQICYCLENFLSNVLLSLHR